MKISTIEMRDAFIQDLYSYAKSDPQIIFISNEYGAPSLDQFRKNLPKQFINAGISEQNIISVAAGLSLSGKKVYVYSIASFITLRCFEQLKIDLCSMKLPVTIIGVGTCYAYSADGLTHHATEDIAIMRTLSNIQIYTPSDSNMASSLVKHSLKSTLPSYYRLDKGKYPLYSDTNNSLDDGFSVLREGEDICMVATGIMIHRAIEVAEELKNYSINSQVIDLYRQKPIDVEKIIEKLKKSKKVITVEEHTINGGLGSIIAEIIAESNHYIPFKKIGIRDDLLYAYGIRDTLHKDRRIDKESIVQIILEWN